MLHTAFFEQTMSITRQFRIDRYYPITVQIRAGRRKCQLSIPIIDCSEHEFLAVRNRVAAPFRHRLW